LGVGVWGFGVGGMGPNPQTPIPNPQSPIPNPQFYEFILKKFKINLKNFIIKK